LCQLQISLLAQIRYVTDTSLAHFGWVRHALARAMVAEATILDNYTEQSSKAEAKKGDTAKGEILFPPFTKVCYATALRINHS
jgi:hypothetical protein